MAKDWQRAGAAIQERRVSLGYRTVKEFAARAKLSVSTVGNIENGRNDNYSPGVRAAVEDALEWAQGSFMAVVEGGKPRPKPDPLLDRVRAVWPKLDIQARTLVAELVEAVARQS